MELQFAEIIPKTGPMLWGALYTIFVGILACCVGILVGTVLLLLRNSRWWLLRSIATVYGSFIRGTPALVQILIFYYALAPLTGVNIGPFTAGIMAIGFNSGAFVAEILRGGLSRIPKGQWEAAEALGLSKSKVWLKIILPQVFNSVIPLLVNEFTMVIKITPLLSTITLVELTRASQMLYNETFRPVEVLGLAAIVYFVICFSISQFGEYLQRRSLKYRV
ncbi:MAG: amino acid ABC transporter permease [Roseibium album]|uniref:L-cystine transport system permease protein TcyB n=1 Tax=Roseibium album TaxID=311410 RepID=A0A0M6ZZ90_9HYPH|nr:amino acid ABC transporter permease [Roseibium album]MBG6145655.1 polar amino acid transport system permease protein [Labrenzia sp. EL_142]MBG6201382.1 polar amino acid transport system permease protein [Labrenzia sp. EL_13]CTQ58578.1 L-cystine transport system permease protein TcyB [Roseibium album]CTQ66853.1 L-cystine transport system permease protein TcyB [Roseibium album]CTQ72008.1 L-cystine transport system permease protein TcyB [Roseibium album]